MPKIITKTGTPRSSDAATYVVGVTRPTASYIYLADGTKVQAIGETGQGYEYVGSLRLSVNGSSADIESIPFAGGRIVKTSNGYEPQYYITDHLGSTRTVVKPNATVVAEFDYMPYGTQHAVAGAPITEADYKYTGKEQQTAFGLDNLYDSQARFQYVTDGSFMSHDDLSGQFPWLSPYNYCAGNPIMFVDPDGRAINFYEIARYLDLFKDSVCSRLTDMEIGPYSVTAMYDADDNIVGYTLMRDRHIEYMADTINDLKRIEDNLEYFITGANLFYINGTPSDGMIAMLAGDIAKGLGQQWIEAVEDVGFWLYVTNVLGLTSTNIANKKLSYSRRVQQRAQQDPHAHNFPYSFDKAILNNNPTVKADGYKIYYQDGYMNGQNGTYEIGVRPNGVIDHRFFRPKKIKL